MSSDIFEDTQELLETLRNLFNSAERFETTTDNLGVSASFYGSLFFGFSMPDNALILTGSALVLGVIYGATHFLFDRRHRDSWNGYLARERDRIERIGHILENIDINEISAENNQERLKTLKNLIEDYEKSSEELFEKLGNTYALELGLPLEPLESETETTTEETPLLSPRKKRILERLLTQKQWEQYQKLTNLISAETTPTSTTSTTPAPTTNVKKYEEKLKEFEAKLNGWDMNLINSTGFNMALSYALAYWLINYFTTLAFPIAATTPVSFALLALVFPALYLIYKEFVTYKERLVEKDLNEITDEEEREKEAKKRNSRLYFRMGWVFIALVIGVSLALILPALGVSLMGAISIGILAFITIIVAVVAAIALVEHRLENAKKAMTEKPVDFNEPENRKKLAAKRRHELDKIALLAYELELQSKLAEQIKLVPANILERTPKTSTKQEEKIKEVVIEEATTRKTPPAEKSRVFFSLLLNSIAGYALGNMIGFVASDFLSHISGVFAPGPFMYIATAIFSIALGALFAKRAYHTEQVHQGKLDVLTATGNLTEKQNTLSNIEKNILMLQSELTTLAKEQRALVEKLPAKDSFNPLKPDFHFVHPVQEEGITKRKLLFGVKIAFQVIVSVATALFFTRMFLLGGFSKLLPDLANGSLLLLGSSINPLGIVILTVALAILAIKLANDIYFHVQREREISALERIDFDIDCKKAEANYLSQQKTLMTQINENLLEKTKPEIKDSHEVVQETLKVEAAKKDIELPVKLEDEKPHESP